MSGFLVKLTRPMYFTMLSGDVEEGVLELGNVSYNDGMFDTQTNTFEVAETGHYDISIHTEDAANHLHKPTHQARSFTLGVAGHPQIPTNILHINKPFVSNDPETNSDGVDGIPLAAGRRYQVTYRIYNPATSSEYYGYLMTEATLSCRRSH